jgi:hypothetical protein
MSNVVSIKGTPVCKCGKQGRLIQMLTFSYYFCDGCRDEVQTKAEKPADNTASNAWDPFIDFKMLSQLYSVAPTGNRPVGYVALKGEALTCANCGAEHGTLNQDLPADYTRRDFSTMLDKAQFTVPCFVCCMQQLTNVPAAAGGFQWHIKGRGWV